MKSSKHGQSAISPTAARLRWAVIAAMVVIVAALSPPRGLGCRLGPARVELRDRTARRRRRRVIVADVTMLLLLVALAQPDPDAGADRAGRAVLGPRSSAHFRAFAFWLLLVALFGFARADRRPSCWSRRPARPHRMDFVLELRDVLTLGVTLILFLLARLLERAREIEEEMREIV